MFLKCSLHISAVFTRQNNVLSFAIVFTALGESISMNMHHESKKISSIHAKAEIGCQHEPRK